MENRFLTIQLAYIRELYAQLPEDFDRSLCATREDGVFHFKAFGQSCTITPEGIHLSGELLTGDMGITIALYARHASSDEVQLLPPMLNALCRLTPLPMSANTPPERSLK